MSFTRMIALINNEILRHLNGAGPTKTYHTQEINIAKTLDKIFVCYQGFWDDEKMTKSPRLTNWADPDLTMDAHFPQQYTSRSVVSELTHEFYEAHKIYLTSRPVILSGWSHLDYHHSGRNTETGFWWKF